MLWTASPALAHAHRGVGQVWSIIRPGRGGISGGTIASAFNIIESEPASELSALGSDAYYLARVHPDVARWGRRGAERRGTYRVWM